MAAGFLSPHERAPSSLSSGTGGTKTAFDAINAGDDHTILQPLYD
jgi:hypothetical protein